MVRSSPRVQLEARRCQDLEHLLGADHVLGAPRLARSQWHVLDEAQTPAAPQALAQQSGGALSETVGHGHGVDLDRRQPRRLCPGHAPQNPVETIATGHARIFGRIQGVDRDVHPVQARFAQADGAPVQAQPVGRQADIGLDSAPRAQTGHCGDDLLQVPSQQRLPAGQANPLHSEALHRQSRQPPDLSGGEQTGRRQPFEPGGGHAVGAAQIAAVRDGQAQVAHGAPVAVGQPVGDRASRCYRSRYRRCRSCLSCLRCQGRQGCRRLWSERGPTSLKPGAPGVMMRPGRRRRKRRRHRAHRRSRQCHGRAHRHLGDAAVKGRRSHDEEDTGPCGPAFSRNRKVRLAGVGSLRRRAGSRRARSRPRPPAGCAGR